ncbi:acyltransferase [Synechococcus sp. CBW1108]|uniref:acyltransferase n=1 Tax=Synechococcus sp. CBW1108 TaxID=1353147 RepID=UPI0019380A01|nr:acyltransferase [Synechococcus sp. CBW1108]QPN69534.1 acyltransferase [Synechococcus sp. CBW1108]
MSTLVKVCIVPMHWSLKRPILQGLYRYNINPSARIGFSWVYPNELTMDAGSRIGDFTVVVNLKTLVLGKHATIGRSNWITGFPIGKPSPHFAHQPNRRAELIIGDHSAITKNHHIDATNSIAIGSYTTIAGYQSQLLSHSIDLKLNRQSSEPITIGSYCFVGTNCIILGGSTLPDFSVLGALSLLNNSFDEPWTLYGGHPAKKIKQIDKDSAFFCRSIGFVE